MEHNKKINGTGAVSLPASLRREYGIEKGEKVNVSVNAKGVIEIKRIIGSCVFCHADEFLKQHEGRFICTTCLQAIRGI